VPRTLRQKRASDIVYTDEETVTRREAALKRMLTTPHKPHSESKIGKRIGRKRAPKARGAHRKAREA
jgi:hypothetical protein